MKAVKTALWVIEFQRALIEGIRAELWNRVENTRHGSPAWRDAMKAYVRFSSDVH